MKIQVQFSTNNDSFEQVPVMQITRIMARIKDELFNAMLDDSIHLIDYPIIDINGNKIGKFTIEKD
jgi:hypothetical protein